MFMGTWFYKCVYVIYNDMKEDVQKVEILLQLQDVRQASRLLLLDLACCSLR